VIVTFNGNCPETRSPWLYCTADNDCILCADVRKFNYVLRMPARLTSRYVVPRDSVDNVYIFYFAYDKYRYLVAYNAYVFYSFTRLIVPDMIYTYMYLKKKKNFIFIFGSIPYNLIWRTLLSFCSIKLRQRWGNAIFVNVNNSRKIYVRT